MKNLKTGAAMVIVGDFITPPLSPHTRIDADHYRWNLNEIASIVTTDTLESAEARAAAVRQARTRRTLTGAVIGGVVDMASGDDGILDGVLIGAAFGYLTANSPEKITAKVGVIFTDGEALSLEVDAKDYTLLQTAAKRALARAAGAGRDDMDARRAAVLGRDVDRPEPEPAKTSYRLMHQQAEYVLSLRQDSDGTAKLLLCGASGIALGVFPAFASLILGMNGVNAEGTAGWLFNTMAEYARFPAMAAIVFGAFYKFFPFTKRESFLFDDDEREAFGRLIIERAAGPRLMPNG